jgi:lysozyme
MTGREKILLGVLAALVIFVGGRKIVSKTKELIAGEEGCRLTVYKDTGGAWTIGWGHLVKAGEKFFPYGSVRTITQAEADALFQSDTAIANATVQNSVRVPLTENQRSALTSLAFNIGSGAFSGSTLVRKLNARDLAGAANEFLKWVYDNGVIVPGLVSRRQRERTVFLS